MGRRNGIAVGVGCVAAAVAALLAVAVPWGAPLRPPIAELPAPEPALPPPVAASEPATDAAGTAGSARTLDAADDPATPVTWSGPSLHLHARYEARLCAGDVTTTLRDADLLWRIAPTPDAANAIEPGLRVRVFADDQFVAEESLRAQVRLPVPAAAAQLRFELRGYRPVSMPAPPAVDGVLACGTVVFVPDAALRVRVCNLPPTFAGTVTFWAGDALVQGTAGATAGAARLQLTLPSSQRIAVGVAGGEPGFYLRMALPDVELARGEVRDLTFDAALAPRCTVRVVGPSPELLPFLELRLDGPASPLERHDRMVAVDAEGCAELLGFPVGDVQFALTSTIGAAVLLRRCSDAALAFPLAAGAAIDVEPAEPIVGLRCVHDGSPRPSRVAPDELSLRRVRSRLVHVVAASALESARDLVVAPDGAVPFRWPPDVRDRRTDLVDVVSHGALQASLLVRCAYAGNRQLQLVPKAKADRGEVFDTTWMQVKDGRVAWDAVEPGDYVLRWGGSTLGTSAVADQHLASGQRCELELQPPADLVAWRVWLANAADVPDWVGTLFIRCNEVLTVWGQDSIVALPADLAAPPVVAFSTWHRLPYVPGRLVEFDPGKRTLVVAFDFAAHAVVPVVQPMFGDAGAASLGTEISGSPRQLDGKGLFLTEGRTLPMCLYEKDDRGAQQLTAWCTVGAGMPAVRGAGRFVDFAIERAFARGSVSVEGPQGHPTVRILDRIAATGRLFVADGTRRVHVDLAPGGRFSFTADVPSIAVR